MSNSYDTLIMSVICVCACLVGWAISLPVVAVVWMFATAGRAASEF